MTTVPWNWRFLSRKYFFCTHCVIHFLLLSNFSLNLSCLLYQIVWSCFYLIGLLVRKTWITNHWLGNVSIFVNLDISFFNLLLIVEFNHWRLTVLIMINLIRLILNILISYSRFWFLIVGSISILLGFLGSPIHNSFHVYLMGLSILELN